MISSVSDQAGALAVSPKFCVFVAVNDGKNRLSVEILQKMAAGSFQPALDAGHQRLHHIHICRSEEEAQQFQGKNVVAVYDSGDYGGYYSPSCTSKATRKPAWVGNEGYVVRVKQSLMPSRLEHKEEILAARVERCARQLSTVFAKAGTVSDDVLFGTPNISWREAPSIAASSEKKGPKSAVRMKSDSGCR